MATYTFNVLGVCSGGEHITVHIYKDGVAVKKVALSRTAVLEADPNIEEALGFFVRQAVKTAKVSASTQIKTAIEAIVVTL
jgi:hypothetical protein